MITKSLFEENIKHMKRQIDKFNTPETYLIISDYPDVSKKSEKNYGIAWHTKEILEPLAKNYNVKFVVLAEKHINNSPKVLNKNILLLRIFDQKHFTLFPRILKWLFVFRNIKKVHIHSEFCVNGGIKNSILVLPFLLLIRLFGKEITYYIHNVVTDLEFLAPHLNIKKKSIIIYFLNYGLSFYYRLLGLFVDKFVVMDQVIKNRLSHFVPEKRIILSPFWVNKAEYPLSTNQSRAKIGYTKNEFVILSFGFITYYKGADWIVNTVQELQKKYKGFSNIRLILAGGEAYSLKDKKYYQQYYNQLLQKVSSNKNITITGFVPENDIGLYFKSADLVVLPYRGLIGASGTLTHALSYKKPFILSDKMGEILSSDDIAPILKTMNLRMNNVTFKQNTASFAQILHTLQNDNNLKVLGQLSSRIAKERSYEKLIANCYNRLYPLNHEHINGKAIQIQPSISI